MKLEPRIHDNRNGLDYVLTDNYYLPALRLPEDKRPIGRWGRLHREYLKNSRPLLYNELLLSGRLQTILADLDEQAADYVQKDLSQRYEERDENFGNARDVRNRFEQAVARQSNRVAQLESPTREQLMELLPEDLTEPDAPRED